MTWQLSSRALAAASLAAASLGSGWVACGNGDADVRERAEAALARGDRPAALEALASLRGSAPETAEGLLELTDLMVRAGEAPEARWLLEAGVERFSEHDALRLQLARVALVVRDPSVARDAVEPIGRDSPHHLDALLLRARAELELGNLERGLALLGEAGQRHPDRPEARLARVATLIQERRVDEARRELEAARRAPELAGEDRRRLEIVSAALDAAQGDSEAAIERLRRLAEEDPLDPQVWATLLPLLLRSAQGDTAVTLLEAAVAAHPGEPLPRGLLAEVHAAVGRIDEAEAALRELHERSGSPSTTLALARFLVARGAPASGARVLAKGVARHPDSPMLRMHLAEAQIEAGELDAARVAIDGFRAAAPRDLHLEYLEARLELVDGKAPAAALRLQRLVSLLDTAYTQFWLGRALERTGDDEGAQRRYGLAAVRDPYGSVAPRSLLRIALARGDWQRTASAARLVLRRAPGDVAAAEALVAALLRLGEAESAERVARALVDAAPERRQAVLLHARALGALDRHAEREQLLTDAIERLGEDPALASELALSLGLRGRRDEAIARLEELARAHPDAAEVQRALALLLLAEGEADRGARAVERALELEPGEPAPLALRARFHASRGDFDAARRDALRYLELRPEAGDVYFLLGFVHQTAGDADAAIAAYRRAAALDAQGYGARNNLALLLAERGALDEALVHAQEAYALAENDPEIIDTLGWLYLEKGLVDRSIAFLERARERAPEHAEVRLHLALAYARAERRDEARALLLALTEDQETEAATRARAHAALRSLSH